MPVCMAIDYTTDDSDDTLTGYIAKIEKGTSFEAYLKNSINTATAEKNDVITAVLTEDWIYNDILIAPQGSILKGKVSKAKANNECCIAIGSFRQYGWRTNRMCKLCFL